MTLRDMLSHRTGITRHDTIWYKSDFTRKELFDRLKYLEPQEPMRTTFLYNNLMFAAVGYMIELQSGKTWEQFVRDRILDPLDMKSTSYSIADMLKQPEHGVGFTERRDSFELYRIPYYEDITGVAPCGAIVSNINDMSHWLIALMNDGQYQGKQVLPSDVLKQTLHAGHRATQHCRRTARLVGGVERRLWHGPPDQRLPRAPGDVSRRRSAGFPHASLIHAEGAYRRAGVRDRQSHRAAIQPDHL